jgi:hypothetical protein
MITGFNRGIEHLDRALHALDCARRDAMDHMDNEEYRRFADSLEFGTSELRNALDELPKRRNLSDTRAAVDKLRATVIGNPFVESDREKLVASDAFTDALHGARLALDGLRKIENEQKEARASKVAEIVAAAKLGEINGKRVSRAEATELLHGVLHKPTGKIGDADALLVGAIAYLPRPVRPDIPGDVYAKLRLSVDWNRLPRDDNETAGTYAEARRALQRYEILHDPDATLESVTEEFDRLVNRPYRQVNEKVLERLAVLESLPEHLRPEHPRLGYSMEQMAVSREWLDEDRVKSDFFMLRETARGRSYEPSTDRLRTDAATSIREGTSMPRGAYRAAVTAKMVDESSLGADPRVLLANGLDGLVRFKQRNPELSIHGDILRELAAFADEIKGDDAVDQKLIAEARTATSTTVKREEGEIVDGYEGEPDFAQLGNAITALNFAALRRGGGAL